jgi:hypothetical protein
MKLGAMVAVFLVVDKSYCLGIKMKGHTEGTFSCPLTIPENTIAMNKMKAFTARLFVCKFTA